MNVMTALKIALSKGDIKWSIAQSRETELYGGFMTMGASGDYQPIMTIEARFSTPEYVEQFIRDIIRGSVYLAIKAKSMTEDDAAWCKEMAGEPIEVFKQTVGPEEGNTGKTTKPGRNKGKKGKSKARQGAGKGVKGTIG